MNLGPWGDLTILAAVMEIVFATCVFVYISRLEKRTSHPLGEKVGAHKAVLAKLRKREPMSQEEVDYATELVADARSPLAYAIPAALFTMGFFYVVGCLFVLHIDGGHPSFRTFIGGIPMLTSMNMAAQLRRVARLKGKLQDVSVSEPEPSDELADRRRASESDCCQQHPVLIVTFESAAVRRPLGPRLPTAVVDEPIGVIRRAEAFGWRGGDAPSAATRTSGRAALRWTAS